MENNDSICYCGKITEIKEIPGCDNKYFTVLI